MLAASAKFRPAVAWFVRQIAPSVLATLIAALVIAGYNRAFSGHLQQPRMAALHAAENAVLPPAVASTNAAKPANDDDAAAKPRPAWLDRVVTLTDLSAEQERIADKDEGRESIKDSKITVADAAPTAVAPAPAVAPRPVTAKPERREPRPEPRAVERSYDRGPVAVTPMAPPPGGYLAVQQPMPQPVIVQQPMQPAMVPVAVAPAPVMVPAQPPVIAAPIAQEPPPVITAKPMVTVPDRPGLRPGYEPPVQEQASGQPDEPRHGVLGSIVNTLKPSSIFKSAREFGDKIESVGNDILPNIRQQ